MKDQPGIIAGLAAILSSHQLNIDAVLQNPGFDKNALPFVITLEPCRDAQLHPALQEMSALPSRCALPLPADSALGRALALLQKGFFSPAGAKALSVVVSAPESSEIFSSSKRDEGAFVSSWQ